MESTISEAERCVTELKAVIFGTTVLTLAAVMNVILVIVIRRTGSGINSVVKNQSYILSNIAIVNIFTSVVFTPLLLWGRFLAYSSQFCKPLRDIAGFVIYSTHCCSFMNFIFLNLNRYISCRFPLTYPFILTKRRLSSALVSSWVSSFVLISFSFLEDSLPLNAAIVPIRKSSTHVFSGIFISCVISVLYLNIRLWWLGYSSYRRELNLTSSVTGPENQHQLILKKNRLKATFISLVLALKNVIAYLPYVLTLQMRTNGITLKVLESIQAIAGPMTTLSYLLDPIICILISPEARQYVGNKLCQKNSVAGIAAASEPQSPVHVINVTERQLTD